MTSCFWAFLSLPKYEFLYLPTTIMNTEVDHHKIKDLLLGRQFLDFVHPDERVLARNDFQKFVDLNTLAGAVTRCRLRKLDCIFNYDINDYGTDLDWIIVDVVMYTTSENMILAFFHCDQGHPVCPHAFCESGMDLNGIQNILSLFQEYNENSNHVHHHEQQIGTLRAFHLYNNVTRNLIMSWPTKQYMPSYYDDILDSIQNDLFLSLQQYPSNGYYINAACTNHIRSSSNITLRRHGTLRFEKILIHYGQITFAVFQISPLEPFSSRFSPGNSPKGSIASTSSSINTTTNTTPLLSTSPSNSNIYQSYNNINNNSINNNNINNNNINNNNINNNSINNNNINNNNINNNSINSSNINNNSMSNNDNSFSQYASSISSSSPSPPSPEPLSYDNNSLTKQSNKKIDNYKTNNSKKQSKSWRIKPNEKKKCESCQTSQSPEWRRGPSGHRTLCNACGLRYSRSLARKEQRAKLSPIMSHASIQQESSLSLNKQGRTKYPGQRRFFNLYP